MFYTIIKKDQNITKDYTLIENIMIYLIGISWCYYFLLAGTVKKIAFKQFSLRFVPG